MPGPYVLNGLLSSAELKNPRSIGAETDRKRACVCLILRVKSKREPTRRFASLAELRAWLEGSQQHREDGEEEVCGPTTDLAFTSMVQLELR